MQATSQLQQRVDAKNVNLAQAAQYFACQTMVMVMVMYNLDYGDDDNEDDNGGKMTTRWRQ